MKPTFSIIIPTFNHLEDLLKPCVESIITNTPLEHVEVIIVANGCTDNTARYVYNLGQKFKLVEYKEAIGYPAAVNAGIAASSGEFIILLNNDVVLLSQHTGTWLDILHHPFKNDETVGATSPVKFSFACGDTTRNCVGFWCAMIRRSVFDKIGLLDTIFTPGTGEDGDFCIKAEMAGYRLVQVPENITSVFGDGIPTQTFPIYHKGSGTFSEKDYSEVIRRNHQILVDRYGGMRPKVSIIIPTYNHLEDALKPCVEAVLQYTDLSDKEVIVVANGCAEDTRAYLETISSSVRYIWLDEPNVITAYNTGFAAAKGEYVVLLDNDSFLQPQAKDTWINLLLSPFKTYRDVAISGPFAHQYNGIGMVIHAGCAMYKKSIMNEIGFYDPAYGRQGYMSDADICLRALESGYRCVAVPEAATQTGSSHLFSVNFPIMHTGTVQTNDKLSDEPLIRKNRIMLYEKTGNRPKYSIVIPTYNRCDELLRPCLDTLQKYTDMSNVEVIVMANGCTDNTREYVESLGNKFKLVWSDEALGYTKATNLGMKAALGDYVVLLNNDTELLEQPTSQWLDMLESPFLKDKTVGMTGPLMLHDNYADIQTVIFFCAMISQELIQKIGLLDEIYSPGGGEDIDYTARAYAAGFKVVQVPTPTEFSAEKRTNVGFLPIWHKENQTFKHIDEYTNWIVKRNGHLNAKRYNKHIKLNLGSGGVEIPGFLSVDMYDKRAHIVMDITKNLDFDDNTVEEIWASHVFEHLNPYDSIATLKEWNRVLKPGGKLIMEMPDIEQLCKAFLEADTGRRYGILNAIYGSVNTTAVGAPSEITSPHLFGWWPQSLLDHLSNAGFINIVFGPEVYPHPEKNLHVEATKPLPDKEYLKSQDPATFQEIFEVNSYKAHEHEIRGKTVVDVGANIGLFTLRCVELGAKQVISVEAQPVVYSLGLTHNVSGCSNVKPLCAAVSDTDGQTVHILNHNVGSKVGGDQGDLTTTITLQTLIKDMDNEDMVLKLDCEGSEYNIVMTSSPEVLRRFSYIYMEVHEDANPSEQYRGLGMIVDKMKACGFELVNNMQCQYIENGVYHPMNIHVQKWQRN